MEKTVKKALKTGYGLGLLTLAQAKEIAASAKKELGLDNEESVVLAKELVASSQKAAKDVLKTAKGHFEKAVVKSGLVTERELSAVEKKIRGRLYDKLFKKKKESVFHRVKSHVSKVHSHVKKHFGRKK